jgi:F-type H+-transporting ATPase subunit a
MHETELWITKIFNDNLAGLGNSARSLVGWKPVPRPWADYIVMELLVVAIIVVLFAVLRTRLSPSNPGKLQHSFELIHEFVNGQSTDQLGHDAHRYLSFFGTLFVFILFANLIGVIPGFTSPTMSPAVTLGCAMAAFLYYNIMGIRANGFKYGAQFLGPVWWLAPLMVLIEIVSHMARPLSLTVRLWANMYAGELVTSVFLGMTYFLVPAIFMGLHVFVSLLQAYIFMLLTMMYVAAAVSHEH